MKYVLITAGGVLALITLVIAGLAHEIGQYPSYEDILLSEEYGEWD